MIRRMSLLLSIVALAIFTVQAATVSGVVKENDSTGAVISGATVTLTQTGGGGAVRLDTTDATGAFSFANVNGTATAAVTYRITAAKTGYRVMLGTTFAVNNATGTFTENLFLVPTGTVGVHTISGTVYDSVAGSALTPLAGARLILSSRTGGAATNLDTVKTGNNGTYTIDSVAVGTYTLTVSDSLFATQTANVIVALVNVTQNFKLIHIQTASITGAVTDSAAGNGIVGAKVYLLTRGGGGGGTIIDSTTTLTGGAYTLSSVPSSAAGVNYTVRASATSQGYVTNSVNITVTGTAAQTANIKLVKILMASITGTVTDSSASGVAAVPQVQVTLRRGTTVVDSTVTGNAGTYTFANVPSGVTYTIRAVATGYVTNNTNIDLTGTAEQTVNIRLVKVPAGNLYVLVKARADSSNISGASVTATIGATALNATTGSSGLVSFLNVETGNYAITVSAANFTAVSSTTTLIANRNDTAKVYLVAAATKTLTGVIKDSASSTPLQHVAVTLVIQGAGVGGTTLTLIDSTDQTGTYTFAGIPSSRTTGRLTATLSGYLPYTNNAVSIGTANQADNTIFNFVLRTTPSGVISKLNRVSAVPSFSLSSAGTLHLNNISDAGMIKVFGVDGKLVYQAAISAQTSSVSLPAHVAKSGNALIISLTQKNATYRKQVMVP